MDQTGKTGLDSPERLVESWIKVPRILAGAELGRALEKGKSHGNR